MYVRDYFGNEDCVSREARYLDHMETGLLMLRGEDEPLVAQLQLTYAAPFNTAELCVRRPGRWWELNEAVPIVHTDGGGGHDLQTWQETVSNPEHGGKQSAVKTGAMLNSSTSGQATGDGPKSRRLKKPNTKYIDGQWAM